MKNILVVGVGNFGAWWIICLSKIRSPLKIYCFDLDPSKYDVLKKRIISNQTSASTDHKIHFLNTLNDAPKKFDTIIISTNADVRLKVIQDLRKLFYTTNWIIEKVMVQSSNQLSSLSQCLKDQNVYVNHSRRLQPATNFCKSILQRKSFPSNVTYLGGRWELASNSFHFIDLINYWFETKLVKIDVDGLFSQWHASSTRKGFFDISGLLIAHFENGIKLCMDWSESNNKAEWIFEHRDGKTKYNEVTGQIYENENILATIPLVNFSEMGSLLEPIIMRDINQKNNLPTLEEVQSSTSILLDSFLLHWRSSKDNQSVKVPIS